MKNVLLLTYQSCFALQFLVVLTIVTAIITMTLCVLGFSRWGGYYPPHIWAKFWCWLMFVSVEVKGRENIDARSSYVFVANHQGAYDIFSIYGFLNHNFKWMMKKSLEKIPFAGQACKLSRHIMVDRSSASAIRETMDNAKKILKDGISLVVFPEGSRTPDGRIKKFKRGAFSLATEFGLPIVPITIDGSYDVMTKSSLRIMPGHIKITIHKPIHFEPVKGDKGVIERLMNDSFEIIKDSLPDNNK